MTEGWPVPLGGVTETVVTTREPDGAWSVAALGVHAGDPATARTYGRTRTRLNVERTGRGVVQFVRDPLVFVAAALERVSADAPVLAAADAWVEVDFDRAGGEASGGGAVAGGDAPTAWSLVAGRAGVARRVVPTTNRGRAAVVEATVAASRLGVSGYDDAELGDRIAYFDAVVRRCGDDRAVAAMDRVQALVDGG
ncbi:MAG: DUF447 domain-containing protein [Halobacteriaceae archaeon]